MKRFRTFLFSIIVGCLFLPVSAAPATAPVKIATEPGTDSRIDAAAARPIVFPAISQDQTRSPRRVIANTPDEEILTPPDFCNASETSCYNYRPCQTGTIHTDKLCEVDNEGFYYCQNRTGKKCGAVDRNNDGLLEKCATCP